MSVMPTLIARSEFPPEQQAIRDKCFHPSGRFVEFQKEEVEQSIPERFEKIVRQHPDRLAVKTANHVLTYAELNATANRVACAILAVHRGESEPIALLFEKDAPLIAAMLGVLKAGKFFVLLDPSFPSARIAAVLADSEPKLVITDRRNASLVREAAGDLCGLMAFESVDGIVSSGDPRLALSPETQASLLYTSGSTGQPKGIIQNHRNMLSKARDYTNLYHVCEQDRFSLLASGTSNSVVNTFIALMQGAALLPFDVQKEGVLRLGGWLLRERISLSWISSPLFRNLAETLNGKETFPDLRLIRLTSEAAYKTDVELYKKYFSPNCILASGMASTETGPLTEYFIDHKTEISDSKLPVGYAVEGKEILLLDDMGNEINPGQIGEIALRGASLFSGYWREPELTAAKFKPDPHNGAERLYLTGDLGLRLPDGCLVHKGRKDYRVKIRGYGVELAEVEKVLLDHPVIRETVVVVQQGPSGEARLVAYFTASGTPPGTSEMRRFLREKLPEYMIPSAFVVLDSLPLTPNGKVDRRALPAPDPSRPEVENAFVAPRTAVEETLAEIWAHVLKVERIGIHDNFFELGGDSIRSMQILAKANQAGLPLSPKDTFEHQTIAELAAFAGTAPAMRSEPQAVTGAVLRRSPRAESYMPEDFPLAKLDQRQLDRIISKLGRLRGTSHPTGVEQIEDIYPLSPAQWGMLFHSLSYPAGSGVYQHQTCYTLRGNLDVSLFERSWQRMVERHSILRTAFLSEPVQVVKRKARLALDYRDWRGFSSIEQQERLEDFLRADRRRRFDISEPPLMRLALFRVSENQYRFIRSSHHVISDGWSMSILWKEVLAGYEAWRRGREPDWKPAPPFRDYIAWLQQQEQNNSAAEAFWQALLKDFTAPTPLEVATGSRRPRDKRETYGRVRVQFSRDETARLQTFARQHRLTMNTLAQAAWALLLSRYSGESDVLFGGVLSVRPSAITGVEWMVGPLINVLPIRAQLVPRDSVRAFLRKLHTQQVEMRQYDYSSLAKVQEWSSVPRRTALFDSVFLFQNYPESPVREQGGRLEIRLDRVFGRTTSPLAVVMRAASELSLAIGFDEDRFETAAIRDMLGEFRGLLRAIVCDPERSVGDLIKTNGSVG